MYVNMFVCLCVSMSVLWYNACGKNGWKLLANSIIKLTSCNKANHICFQYISICELSIEISAILPSKKIKIYVKVNNRTQQQIVSF